MQWSNGRTWKILGLAGFAGVAATGVVVVRAERRRRAYTPDEIRARLSVSQVVGRKVALKRAGREHKGLSPFKTEKTPSFTVNDQKGFYHCFASGEHGDIFTFVMKTQNLSFPEAVERLAEEAGLEMPRQSREDAEQAVDMAAAFFRSRAVDPRVDPCAGDGVPGGRCAFAQRPCGLGTVPPGQLGLTRTTSVLAA